jgi:hypothetical protein
VFSEVILVATYEKEYPMSEYDVDCPHVDCYEPLLLQWHQVYTLSPADMRGETNLAPENSHARSWQIECAAGHVLLIPGPLGCPCKPEGNESCPHNEDDFDWSEDYRNWQPHDYQRLRNVAAAIAIVGSTIAGGGAS